jgi:hypothetical protein
MYTAVAGLLNILAIYDAYEGPAFSEVESAAAAEPEKVDRATVGALKPEAQA